MENLLAGYFILFLFFKSASRSASWNVKKKKKKHKTLNMGTLGYPVMLTWSSGSVPEWNH